MSETTPGRIVILDLGVASWTDKHLSDNIQPEHLRAPEVILGAPWDPPVDIWSLGCLVMEFVKGHVAFLGAASEGRKFAIPRLKVTNLADFVDGKEGPFQRPDDMTSEDALRFVDFLRGALQLDPDERKTAGELLQHEWLR
ncbi:hypothetical protein LTR29_015386 [Friedmanniomyces endolithicus]|nr:hypothetical protein LTR29_015386 [Friedmanniomyces endolithicus]